MSSPPEPPGTARARAVFLDRDGTLNVDTRYLKDPDRLEIHLGVSEGLRLLRSAGLLLLVVTNQSGIARGLYTVADVEALHQRLRERLALLGASLDAFYFCPHAPEEHCPCRKPGVELFRRAEREWGLDLSRSAILGDRYLDVQAGKRLGMLSAYVPEPGSWDDYAEERPLALAEADLPAENFLDAARRIVQRMGSAPVG